MAAYVAGSLAGNGQTIITSSLTVTIPATAQVGDVAIVHVAIHTDAGTWTTPAGWTLIADYYRTSPNITTSLFGRVLTAGQPGSTVTFPYSISVRMVATVSVFRGVTLTGSTFSIVGENVSPSTTLPTLPSVPAGAMLVGAYGRESTSSAAQLTSTPAGYTAGGVSKSAYASLSNMTSSIVYKLVGAGGAFGGETATTSVSSSGLNYLLSLPTTDATVYGATASVTAQALVVDGGIPTGPVSVAGATAQVLAQGGVEPVPPVPRAPATWPPDPFRQAIRGPVALWYTVDALLGGVPVEHATDLAPTGGSITDTTRPGVRRVLNLELAPAPGLFDLLSPAGTQLKVTAHVRYTNRTVQDLPMGLFVVDREKIGEGGGGIDLTAPDKWSLIQAARFVQPRQSFWGWLVTDQIAALIRDALGEDEQVYIYSTSTERVGPLTWEKDRDKAILDLAKAASLWVYFDRDGIATIADMPTVGESAAWLVDASASGVMTALDRERSRAGTCNVVVVESSAADGALFPTQVVWDDDPFSPTYAGTDPVNAPETAGPFGIVPYYFDTPLLLSVLGARNAGRSILARVSGLASQISAGQVPNPAVNAFDVLDVLAPRERYDLPRVLERHVADTVTHPLAGGEQHIAGRSTRTEEIEGGS